MIGTRLRALVGHPAVGAIARLCIGGIFIYASFPKLLRPDEFARLVYGYHLLHPELVNLAGITLPWIEFVSGVFLVVGLLPRASALVIAGLLCVFIAAGILALARGLEIDCGCFFPFMAGHKVGWDLIVRDTVLLLLPFQVLIWPTSFLPGRGSQSEKG